MSEAPRTPAEREAARLYWTRQRARVLDDLKDAEREGRAFAVSSLRRELDVIEETLARFARDDQP